MERLLEKIEVLIRSGQTQQAMKAMGVFKKKHALDDMLSIRFSEWYLRLHENEAAIKTLGKELDLSALAVATPPLLYRQIKLADCLRFIGAKYICERIYSHIDQIIRERSIPLQTQYPRYNHFRGIYYHSRFEYERALQYFEQYSLVIRPESYESKINTIYMADCFEGAGRLEEALSTIQGTLALAGKDEKVLRGICHQVKGEYLFRAERFSEAKGEFELARQHFPSEVKTKDTAYLCTWLGAISGTIEKDMDKAAEYFTQSESILVNDFYQPHPVLELLYWMEKTHPNLLGIEKKIALRAHPGFSYFSNLAGRISSSLSPGHYWVKKQIAATKVLESYFMPDCWLIDKNQINPVCYKQVIGQFIKAKDANYIDLQSAYFHVNQEISLLTELENKALIALIGVGNLGINMWALYDFIYRQDFFNPNTAHERLKKLLSSLQKKFATVKRKNNSYVLDWSELWNKTASGQEAVKILLPMNYSLTYSHLHGLKSVNQNHLTEAQVAQLFNVSKSTAIQWIKEISGDR